MTYQIAICDDNNTDTEYISSLVNLWSKENNLQINISTFSSAEEFLFHYADKKNYDLLLLDIEMKKIDGVTLAKTIRKENEAVQIVFITGYSDYISEGYEVAALHYLIKPINTEKLFTVLNRAVKKINKNDKILNLMLSNEMIRIPLYEIKYLEVNQNYVTIHCKEKYTIKKTLSEFEKELNEDFFRAGRSFILNLNYIQKITKTTVYLSDGSTVPLARGLYDKLNKAIISHM